METTVKVWNRNTYDYSEEFRGKKITIPASDFIEMAYDEAVLFLGSFTPIVRKGDGTFDPRSFKKLEIDKDDKAAIRAERMHSMDADEKEKVFVCHACAKEFLTKTGLEKHIKSKHMSDMADKEAMKELHDREDI